MRSDSLALTPPRDCCSLIGTTLRLDHRLHRTSVLCGSSHVFKFKFFPPAHALSLSFEGFWYLLTTHCQRIFLKLYHWWSNTFIAAGAIVSAKMYYRMCTVCTNFFYWWQLDGCICGNWTGEIWMAARVQSHLIFVLRRASCSWKKWHLCPYINYCFNNISYDG